ncbi:MAG: tyrosine-type recombinase/integrase [Acidobacteriota bacterium]
MKDLAISLPAQGRDLTPLLEQAAQFLEAAKAGSTRRAYASDLRDFAAFCDAHDLPYLPSRAEVVALYISDLAARVTVATIQRRLSAITYAHREAGFESPASPRSNFILREVLSGIRRTLGTAQQGADPLLAEAVKQIAAACPATLLGARDRALVLLGFSGAFRTNEVATILRVEDLTFTPRQLYIRLRRSKTDQEQAGRTVVIGSGENEETCPVRALRAWLEAGGIRAGPVFRAVDRHGHIGATALSTRSVSKILKGAAERAGIDPRNISGHSLRVGMVTTAALEGVEEREIALTTAHKSSRMVRRYIRDAALGRANMTARLGL